VSLLQEQPSSKDSSSTKQRILRIYLFHRAAGLFFILIPRHALAEFNSAFPRAPICFQGSTF
jgi:hypothetical protein